MARPRNTQRALVPEDVLRHPRDWALIEPREAAGVWRRLPVVVVTSTGGRDSASWYNGVSRPASSPRAVGAEIKYYRYAGTLPVILDARRWGAPPEEAIESEGEGAGGEDEASVRAIRGDDAAPEDSTHWIEIELVDEEGNPVPEESFWVECPDGSIAEGKLDSEGRARIDGIDPGTCTVTFPDLDGRDWRRA